VLSGAGEFPPEVSLAVILKAELFQQFGQASILGLAARLLCSPWLYCFSKRLSMGSRKSASNENDQGKRTE